MGRVETRYHPQRRALGPRVLLTVLPAFATALFFPKPALAQSAVLDAEPSIGCFRGNPLPRCKSFWIFEMQGSLQIAQTSRLVDSGNGSPQETSAFDPVFEWNLGHMMNTSDEWAFGGVITVGTGNSNPLTGLKARARRWMSSQVSVEAETGALWSDASGHHFPGLLGGTTALRLNIRDQGQFYLRWDVLPLPEERSNYSGGREYFDPGGVQHGVSVGASVGSVPSLVGTGALGVGFIVLLAILANENR
jgi:hypothetical protein